VTSPLQHNLSVTTRIHPRLAQHRNAIATALNLDDSTEVEAAVEEIQTLLVRCGYHLRYQRSERLLQRKRRSTRSNRAPGSATPPRRGRPKGSANWAARQLALGLADIWHTHIGRTPTRRIYWSNGLGYGPYHRFVALIHGLLPSPLQRTWMGDVVTVDYMVRIGIEEFKATDASPSSSRDRGLIEQHRWDGSAAIA
jgi:hypothetical protein